MSTEGQIDKNAVDAFDARTKGAQNMVLTLLGVCEGVEVKNFTPELKEKYMHTLWSRMRDYFEEVNKENGDV